MDEMKKLINELNKASELYYNGKDSFLTDKEFDIKLDQLKKLEQKYKVIYSNSPTINVGAPVLTELTKVQIKDKPMLSLDKVHSAEEIIKFSDGYDLIASIKCDGLSVRLIYQDTDLVSANTRGNGYQGSDITEHVKHFLNVPLKIAKTGTYIIDGEAIIYDKDFDIINKNNKSNEFKNSRNTASGALTLLDMSIVEDRKLSFIAWDVIEGANTKWYHSNLEEAKELGFTTVPAMALDCTKIEKEEIDQINEDLITEAKQYYGIPCDGVVWRINDIDAGDKKGQTEHHFLNAVAWKPEDEEYETELLDIEWSMGRTGILTPVAIFKPVDDGVSVIERASLHNLSVMKELLGEYPKQEQKIWVVKANQIIPQISRAIKNDILHDHVLNLGLCPNCPICGEPTEIIKSDSGVLNIFCKNPSCEGKLLNRIEHYCGKKGLDIKGISKATISKLIDWGWLKTIKDIYFLDCYSAEWSNKTGFGKISVNKIIDTISSSQKNTDLTAFIAALGIPLVGKTIAKEITKIYSTWNDFRAAVGDQWSTLPGFGPELEYAINHFDYTEADEIAEILIFKQEDQKEISENNAIKDKNFVITGKLISGNFKNRDELKKYIEDLGGKVTGSVTSKTDYLINNDNTSTSSKNLKAKELGVSIITEKDFLNLVKNS